VENLNLNKSISIQQTRGSLKIKIPISRNNFATAATFIILMLWLAIGGFNLLNYLFISHIFSSILFAILWFTIAVFLTDGFFLYLKSYEEIIIESGLLSTQRKGVFLKRSKSFIIEDISKFKVQSLSDFDNADGDDYKNGERPTIDGIIRFKYKFEEESIGIGLKEEEAVELLNMLVLNKILTNEQWQYIHKPKSDDSYYG
jgi:hypothetical protein